MQGPLGRHEQTQCIPLGGSLPSTQVRPGVREWATADQGEAGTASGGAPTAVSQGLEQQLPLYNPPLRSPQYPVTGTSGTHSLGLHLAGSPAMPCLAQGLHPPPQCQADTYGRSLPSVSLPLFLPGSEGASEPARAGCCPILSFDGTNSSHHAASPPQHQAGRRAKRVFASQILA
ncbi:hypothetical protein BN1723_008672, partial [Verticillium longisporum]